MSDPSADPPPPPDDSLAAEQALGLLEGAEREAAERRLAAEPAFAEAVEGWRLRLARIADEAPARPPPPGLWARIASRLGGEVIELRLRRGLARWRAAACGLAALAACLAAVLAWPRPERLETARLAGKADGRYVYVIVYDATRRRAVFTLADQPSTEGRTPQLWVLPPSSRPISIGVGSAAQAVSLPVDPRLLLAGHTLAVSLEPLGGSPTGQPTGPVVATGALRPI